MKIAILIPSTSKGRDSWKTIKDSYLYNYTLKTFLLTYDKEHEYTFYIGFDYDDRIYSKKSEQSQLTRFGNVFPNVSFDFTEYKNIKKGFLTKMWNILFKKAYDDGFDYFYQTGDDIQFKTKNWVNDSINILKDHDNIGLSGPINNNPRILTQAMVSRKHMEIFGFFFPEEIQNWCCDDWYNFVYKPNYFYPLKQHSCINAGGTPRYVIDNNPTFRLNFNTNLEHLRAFTTKLSNKHKKWIKDYISKNSGH